MQYEYSDETIMHTGAHINKKFKDIPASYFLYCYKNGYVNNLMKAYIEKNIKRFELTVETEKQQKRYEKR